MAKPCKRKGEIGAVLVRTFTGTDKKTIVCQISAPGEVKHFVWVQNLFAYKTVINCSSQILPPKLIRFDSIQPEDKWKAKCELDGRQKEEFWFTAVSLSSKQPNSGEQAIKVRLTVDRRRERGTTVEGDSFEIEVLS